VEPWPLTVGADLSPRTDVASRGSLGAQRIAPRAALLPDAGGALAPDRRSGPKSANRRCLKRIAWRPTDRAEGGAPTGCGWSLGLSVGADPVREPVGQGLHLGMDVRGQEPRVILRRRGRLRPALGRTAPTPPHAPMGNAWIDPRTPPLKPQPPPQPPPQAPPPP